MFVPVVDKDQHSLMPTTPARARRWLKSGKATAFWKGGFFCVRLNIEPAAREYQPVACGIDPGSKKEALVVVSAAHTYTNIQADAVTWVKEAEALSTRMRRAQKPQDALPQAETEPRAEQEEAAPLDQGTLALETEAGTVPLPPLPDSGLRGRGYPRSNPSRQAGYVEPQLFPTRGRKELVLPCSAHPGPCYHQAGMGDESNARSAWPQEDEEENC